MIIRYTNIRNEFVEFSDGFPYKFLNIDGLGGTEADIQSQRAPHMDGEMYVDSVMSKKPLPVQAAIKSYDTKEVTEMRRRISRVFNPKLGVGTLKYIDGDDVKVIECVPESSPFFPIGSDNQSEYVQKVIIDLMALDPYWRDPNQTSKPLQAYVGNFTLPTTFPIELGVAGSRTTLYNEGDVPAPIQIDVHGPTTNPQIINRTTGERIKVNRAIAEDEILHINTMSGQKQVEIRRGDEIKQAFGYLDHDSEWITLELGENEIEHIADSGDRKAIVEITWSSRYVGV